MEQFELHTKTPPALNSCIQIWIPLQSHWEPWKEMNRDVSTSKSEPIWRKYHVSHLETDGSDVISLNYKQLQHPVVQWRNHKSAPFQFKMNENIQTASNTIITTNTNLQPSCSTKNLWINIQLDSSLQEYLTAATKCTRQIQKANHHAQLQHTAVSANKPTQRPSPQYCSQDTRTTYPSKSHTAYSTTKKLLGRQIFTLN